MQLFMIAKISQVDSMCMAAYAMDKTNRFCEVKSVAIMVRPMHFFTKN